MRRRSPSDRPLQKPGAERVKVQLSRVMRGHPTPAEARLWSALRSRQLGGCATPSVILPKANRKAPATFDKELYQARSAVECTLNLLKQARRFATRYEKTLRNYSAVVAIGCALLWLRI